MTDVAHNELPLEVLRGIGSISRLLDSRGGPINLVWTSAKPLELWFLNALSPAQEVFWDFPPFACAARAHQSIRSELKAAAGFERDFDAWMIGGGLAPSDWQSRVLLGGVTAMFGERYGPPTLGADYFRLARRHHSLVVPESCRDKVGAYFSQGAAEFGASATKRCSESQVLVNVGPDLARDRLYGVLAAPLGRLSHFELQRATEASQGTDIAGWEAGADLDWRYSCARVISVGLMRPPEGSALKALVGLAQFRARVARSVCPIDVLETLATELETPGWREMPHERDAIREVLSRHGPALVSENPFQAWGE